RIGRAAYALWMYGSIRNTVTRLCRRYQPDVILGTWAYPDAVAVAALARRLGIPWVAKVHGSDINAYALHTPVQAQIRWALRQAARIFTMSAQLQQRLVQIGVPASAIRVQHNGINVERFALQDKQAARMATGLPLGRPIAVYVGNLKVSKGIMDLAEAARLLAAGASGVGVPACGPDQASGGRAGLPNAQRPTPNARPLIVLVGDGPARPLLAEALARN